jgi:uncharacterized delta-60 repeat protein
MRPRIPWLAGVLGSAAAIVACSEIAGLGPPIEVSDTDSGTDADEKSDTCLSDTCVPDAYPSDAGEHENGEGGTRSEPDAGPGSLDPTFGNGGMVSPGGGFVGPHGLAIQPENGDIVYCGRVNRPYDAYILLVGRLKPDGSPDTALNASGQLTAEQPGYEGTCNAVALVPGGAIVAAGVTYSMWAEANYQMVTARFTDQGQLDPTLGSGTGFARVNVPTVSAQANAMVLLPDDSMMLGGVMVSDPALALLSAEGLVDPTFGSSDAGPGYDASPADDAGIAHIDVLTLGDAGAITQLLPRRSGGYVATSQSTEFLTIGITASGSIDPSYGSGGQAWAPVPEPLLAGAVDMVVQPGGEAVCVGSTVGSIELVRFAADGGLDTTFFGHSGHASVKTPLTAVAIAQLPDGRLAVAVNGSGGVAGVVLFTANGVLDTKFGTGGYALFPVTVNANSEAIAVDGMGRVYLAVGADSGIVIFRILS